MTIQLPVLLWTVICFVLLMLILSRLLFRPLLDFMDRREEKIRSAARKLEETEQARRDAEEKLARSDRKRPNGPTVSRRRPLPKQNGKRPPSSPPRRRNRSGPSRTAAPPWLRKRNS